MTHKAPLSPSAYWMLITIHLVFIGTNLGYAVAGGAGSAANWFVTIIALIDLVAVIAIFTPDKKEKIWQSK